MARILVIDDDAQVRRLMRVVLERDGHAVTEAENGVQGVARFRADPADLVITDLIMPEQEGLQTIRELSRECLGLPIIAISGSGLRNQMDCRGAAERFGACRMLEKPFMPHELLTAVREELEKRSAA